MLEVDASAPPSMDDIASFMDQPQPAAPLSPMGRASKEGADRFVAEQSAPSELGSFVREGARSILPGLAGFAGGAASGAAMGAMGAGPVGAGVGAIVGAIGSAMTARKISDVTADAYAPDSFMGTASAATDYQTNPLSSLVGGTLAQGRPGPLRALSAAKTIATAEGRGLLAQTLKQGASAEARTALSEVADVGLGAGIGGGMSLATGDGMALENAGLGALFNRSWIGGHPAIPSQTEAPPVNDQTGIIPVAPEVIRGPVTRMGNGEMMEPARTGVMWRNGLPAPEAPAGMLPAPPPAQGLPAVQVEAPPQMPLPEVPAIEAAPALPEPVSRIQEAPPIAETQGEAAVIPEASRTYADPARAQELKNSISEGEMILSGKKANDPSSAPIERAIANSKAKLDALPPEPPADPQLSRLEASGKGDTPQAEAIKRRYARAGTIETDPSQQDFTDFIAEHPIRIADDKTGGEWDGFKEWHQSIPPLYKSERHFSKVAGRGIAEVADAAHRANLIDAPDPKLLMDKYSEAIRNRKTNRTTGDLNPLESKALALEKKAPRQAKEFDTALVTNRRSRAGEKVLAEGETFHFQGEPFKVTRSEAVEGFDGPEGLVVLQDHDKFGTQVVDASQPLRISSKDKSQVWDHEGDRAQEILTRRQPADSDEIPPIADEAEDEPSFLREPTKPPTPEPTAEPLTLETQTEESIKSEKAAAKRKAEIEKGLAAPLKGSPGDTTADIFGEGETPLFNERRDVSPGERKSILDSLKAHRASVDQSIKDGRGNLQMSMFGVTAADVTLIYRAALDIGIATLEAGKSVNDAVKAALAHIKTAAPTATKAEMKEIERRLFAETNDARRFAEGRDAKFKVELPKIAQDLAGRGNLTPTIGDLTAEMIARFPDQAAYIRANADSLLDQMIFHKLRMEGKSERAREWSEWLDAAMDQGAKISQWAKKGTPFRDIGDKLNLFNRTYFGTIGAKMVALADGRLNGLESPALQKFVKEFAGLEAGAHGVNRRSLDVQLDSSTKAYANDLDKLTADLNPYLSKLPKREKAAFWERVTDHVTDPARDGELASQPEMKRAVDAIVKLRTALYDEKIAAGVDMGDAGPRSMPRRPDMSRVLGNEKEFVAQAAKAYKATWAREVRKLAQEQAAALAAGDKKAANKAVEKIREVLAQDADDFARKYLYAIQSDDIGISADGDGDLFKPHNGNPSTEKSRVFGPEADQLLGKFYERSALDLMRSDINNSTRAAMVAKALSGKNPDGTIDPLGRWKSLRKEMEGEGNRVSIPMVAELIKDYFNLGGHENPKIRRFLELAHTHTQIGRLSHAMLASLGEPVLTGMRHGGGISAMGQAFGGVAKSLARRLRGSTPGEWQIVADFMGVTSSGMNSLLTASRHMDAFGGRTGGKLVSRFHVLTMLTDFTNATHEIGVKMGHAHILAQLQTAKAGGTYANLAKRALNEVGITGAEIDDVLKFAKQLEATADKAALLTANTPEAAKYLEALHLFRDSGATLEPTRGSRPQYANTAAGSIYYQLSSFLYAFHEKVNKRSFRRFQDAATGKTMVDDNMVDLNPAERVAIVKNVLQGFAAIAAAQYGIQRLRETVLPDPIRDQKNKKRTPGEIQSTRLMSTVSRTGVFGPYDSLFNLISGARYQRDASAALLGPALGGAFELFGNTAKLMTEKLEDATNDRTTPRSNLVTRKFGRSVSDMIVTPALSAVGATLPGRVAGGILIQGASNPDFRERITKGIGGPMRIEK